MKDTVQMHRDGYKFREENYKYCFDLENWRKSESYKLIKKYCKPQDSIFEIGCLTGHHLLLLDDEGYTGHLHGIDFVPEAILWGMEHDKNKKIEWENGMLKDNDQIVLYDKIILFDVLEHQDNVGEFLERVITYCVPSTEVLVLVPKGEEYFDLCHINFYPSIRALENTLGKYFTIIESYEIDNKIFVRCKE